ncbi:MAG: secretin N-terminal domain-containing protein, partial [Acetobacteraceae bacterium]
MRVTSPTILAVLLLLLSGCVSEAPAPLLTPLPPLTNGAATAPRVNGNVGSITPRPTALVSYGVPPLNRVPVGEAAPTPEGNISLDFADTDIREVVAEILGKILKVNYTIDPAVHGTASLRTVRPLTRSQLLPTLQTLLAGVHAVLVRANGIYRVVPSGATGSLVATSPDLAGSEVVPLHYVSAETLAKTLLPFVGPSGRIIPEAGSNALIVSGSPDTRQAFKALIASFDTDALAGQSYALFAVPRGGAKDFAAALERAFRAEKGDQLAGQVRVLPLERVNAVLAVASAPPVIGDMQRVYALLQQKELQNTRTWHVYYLKNTDANDTAYVLQQAFTPNNVTALPPGTGQIAARQAAELPSSTGFGTTQTQPGTAPSGAAPAAGGPAAPGYTPAAGSAAAPSGAGNPLLGGLDVTATGAGGAPEGMRIIPNDQNNALLVYANEQ